MKIAKSLTVAYVVKATVLSSILLTNDGSMFIKRIYKVLNDSGIFEIKNENLKNFDLKKLI
jgi:hypothetical protein